MLGPDDLQPQETDAELVRAVARGDERAFASLYDRYHPTLLGFLIRILRESVEAEDVLQEVFLQVWEQASSYDESRGRPFTWMVTIARSRAVDRLRASGSRLRLETTATQEPREETADLCDDAIRSERGETVRRALEEIPEEPRRILLLAYFEGLTQSEIAARIGKPLGTVKTRARAGLSKLRELLSKGTSKDE